MEHPIIVCYTGGTCGDLICSLLDPTGMLDDGIRLVIDARRSRFKKPHTFNSIEEKDQYLSSMSGHGSIPSHDLEYHRLKQHRFIGIRVQDKQTALWAATRFKSLHRLHVWEEMSRACGAKTVEEYAQMLIDFGNYIAENTDKIINLEDIVSGQAIEKLESMVGQPLDFSAKTIYTKWLEQNKCKLN